MIYKKYRMIVLCLVTACVLGAAERSQVASSSAEPILRFQDCIEVHHMPMHGVPQYFEPVVVWEKVVTEGKLHSGCKSIVGGRNGSFFRSKQRYKYWDARAGLGFIVGPNKDLTTRARDEVLKRAPEFSDFGYRCAATKALQEVTKELKQERPEATQQVDDILVDVETYTSGCAVSIVAPERLKRKFLKRNLQITNELHVQLFHHAMCGCQKLITHYVPYLVLNRERLAQFVAQEGLGTLVVVPEGK